MITAKQMNMSAIEANSCQDTINDIIEEIIRNAQFGMSRYSAFISHLNSSELDCIESCFRHQGFITELTEEGELKIKW